MNPKCLSVLCAWLLLGCTISATGAPVSAAATQAFNRAVAAFQTGKYQQALADFLEARREELDNTQLTYDLGVTYFRLGQYAEARHEFAALFNHPALTHYNLGLISMRQQDRARARSEFNSAYLSARDSSLRTLISKALAELGAAPPVGTPSPYVQAVDQCIA